MALASMLAIGCIPKISSDEPDSPSHALTNVGYRRGDLPRSAKIFLVAGGDDSANFAAEVVAQRELWRELGLADDEIVCYWAQPTPEAFHRDREQYLALARDLRDCFAAKPSVLREHLSIAARHRIPFLYLYVTGHGLQSVLDYGRHDPKTSAWMRELSLNERRLLDQHSVGLEAEDGPGLEDVTAIVAGHRAGRPDGDLMFSPRALRDVLLEFPPTTEKIVVIQGCFTGGFIDPNDELHTDRITDVPNLVAITATRHDRPSFGCHPGSVATYFGGAFTRVLRRHAAPGLTAREIPWRNVFEDTAFVVETLERIEGERPSAPRFFDNRPAVNRPTTQP